MAGDFQKFSVRGGLEIFDLQGAGPLGGLQNLKSGLKRLRILVTM